MPLKETIKGNRGNWIWGLGERKKKGVVHRWGKLRPWASWCPLLPFLVNAKPHILRFLWLDYVDVLIILIFDFTGFWYAISIPFSTIIIKPFDRTSCLWPSVAGKQLVKICQFLQVLQVPTRERIVNCRTIDPFKSLPPKKISLEG